VLAKLVGLDQLAADFAASAQAAEVRLTHARDIVNGKNNAISAEEYEHERSNFDATLAAAKMARDYAESAHKVLAAVKAWLEALPPDSRLLMVQPAASDLDLAALRARLAGLRDELRRHNGTPPAASDVGQKVDAYVASLAARALPLVRGFAQGQSLQVTWPAGSDATRQNGVGFSAANGNALLLFAALFPHELAELVVRAVNAEQPLSAHEHAARRAALEHAIDELSYVVAALNDQAGAPPDVLMAPWHVLGVRLDATESEGAAAA
jgi:hypothetical protein